MAKLKKLANKKQIIKFLGLWLAIEGLVSMYYLNLLPNTEFNFAFFVRFIRVGIGLYLIWS